jgi:Skp family chaperone for outer membrane proteins
LLEALSFDITSAVNIGFENGESIFKDKKTQKMVADSLMREIRKRLNGFKI